MTRQTTVGLVLAALALGAAACTSPPTPDTTTTTTLESTTTTTTTAPAGGSPVAALSTARSPGGVRVAGTATDPDTTDPLVVDVAVDGVVTSVSTTAAGTVDRTVPITAPESSTVCVTVRNVGVGDNLRLNCKTVPGTRPAVGITRYSSGLISGYALDYDTAAPIRVGIVFQDALGQVVGSRDAPANGPDGAGPTTGSRTIFGATPSTYGTFHRFAFGAGPFPGTRFCLDLYRDSGQPLGRVGCYPLVGIAPTPASPGFGTLYDFIATSPLKRLNPCEPVHYVMNVTGMTPEIEAQVHESFTEAEAATGIDFRYDGPTDERLSDPPSPLSDLRPNFDLARYGNRWSPLLVSLATADELPSIFVGTVVGYGGANNNTGGRPSLTGFLVLKRDYMWDAPTGYDPGASGRAVLHEIGHVLGLRHVNDPVQLMYPSITSNSGGFQAGDLAGLAFLGTQGGCLTTE